MMHSFFNSQDKVLIYGYGAEGCSAESFLCRYYPQTALEIFTDDNSSSALKPDLWNNFTFIILSPGVSMAKVPSIYHQRCLSNTQLFFAHLPPAHRHKIIGVSGSKGKSTTTKLIAECLRHQELKAIAAGNCSPPLLDQLPILPDLDYLVAELSSFQLAKLSVSPSLAIFTALFADHQDRYSDFSAYLRDKSNLWRHQGPTDRIYTLPILRDIISAGKGTRCFPDILPVDYVPSGSIWRAEHWRSNFSLVQALLSDLFSPAEAKKTMRMVLENFVGLPHRMQWVACKDHIDFYNDSIATNPTSSTAAIKFFANNLGDLIIGGSDTGGDDFDDFILTTKNIAPTARIVIINSPIADLVRQAMIKHHFTNFLIVDDLESAVSASFALKNKHKVVLLSPAAKSFDAFINYVQRGNRFINLVQELPASIAT